MCGVVGVFGGVTKDRIKCFNEMLIQDIVRGPHSTGVAAAYQDGYVRVIKEMGPATELVFYNQKYTKKVVEGRTPALLMGHNRWATIGDVNIENAHPFIHKHITMAHNGTLDKGWEYDWDKVFGTDSETLAYSIAEVGIDETWKKLRGAATIVYWDNKDKSLNIVTNGKRPIFIGHSSDFNTLIYASEVHTLLGCAARNHILLDKERWQPKNHWLCTFRIKGNRVGAEYRELTPFTWKSVVHYPEANTTGFQTPPFDNYSKGWVSIYGDKSGDKSNVTPLRTTSPAGNFSEVDRDKGSLTKAKFAEQYDMCCFCGNDIEADRDFTAGAIINSKQALCAHCVGTVEKEKLVWVL